MLTCAPTGGKLFAFMWGLRILTPLAVYLSLSCRKGTLGLDSDEIFKFADSVRIGLHHSWKQAAVEGQALHVQHVWHVGSVLLGHNTDFRFVCFQWHSLQETFLTACQQLYT